MRWRPRALPLVLGSAQMTSVRPQQGLVLELLGVPGSGKTSLYADVRAMLAEAGVKLRRPKVPEHDALIELYQTDRREFFDASMRYLRSSVQHRVNSSGGDPKDLLREHAHLWFARCYEVESALERPGVQLLEEGTVHELWRQYFFMRDAPFARWWTRQLWRTMPHCTGAVLVQATPQAAVRRIAGKRKLGPINRNLAAHSPTGDLWRQTDASYHRLAARALRRPTALVVDNNLDQRREENAREITRTVLNLAAAKSPKRSPLDG